MEVVNEKDRLVPSATIRTFGNLYETKTWRKNKDNNCYFGASDNEIGSFKVQRVKYIQIKCRNSIK